MPKSEIGSQKSIEAGLATSLPCGALMRLSAILAPRGPIPVSRSTWWAGIKTGRFPKPVKIGPRTTVWHSDDIQALIDKARSA